MTLHAAGEHAFLRAYSSVWLIVILLFPRFLAVARGLLVRSRAYLSARTIPLSTYNPHRSAQPPSICAPERESAEVQVQLHTHFTLSTLVTTCSSVHSYRRQEAALRASASGRPLPSPLGPPRSRLQPRALRASPRCPAPRACPPAARAPRPRRAPTPEGTRTPHMHGPHARPAPWEAPG